jgi:hypothetical protein
VILEHDVSDTGKDKQPRKVDGPISYEMVKEVGGLNRHPLSVNWQPSLYASPVQ